MTLDKFISRGFTSSVGDSSGTWVARDPSTQPAKSFVPQAEGGTSFVLGSTRPGVGKSAQQSKPFEYRDPFYGFNEESVRYGGTRQHHNAHPGCFGNSSRRARGYSGGGGGTSGTIDGHKAVVALFMAAIIVGIAVLITSGMKIDSPKAKNPQLENGGKRAPNRSIPPVWYR
jgi:hypothetical protein